jgi:hypothetical protein
LVCDENLPKKRKNDENLWIYMKNLNSDYNLGVWMDLEKKMISESAKSMEINEMTWCSCNYEVEICRKSGICRMNIRRIAAIQFKFSNCGYRWFFFPLNKGLFYPFEVDFTPFHFILQSIWLQLQ